MNELNPDIFSAYDKGWALVTAGSMEDFNTMTISWGGAGTLWGKPVATVYVKPCRYTHSYLDKNEYFTVSFFPEDYRKDLALLGTKSGRDGDKVAETKLHPVAVGDSVGFAEASETLLCKKIYRQDMQRELMPAEAVEKFYKEDEPHTIFIGEVLEILK